MSAKIAADHLARGAVVYVRQSTMTQVHGNLEGQRRQYALADAARAAGFSSVTVIDDDLGRSGSGLAARPGFQRLVAELCAGAVGAVFCLEASRLARNGRDWHHLVDLCALTGALVVDPDGVYDPRLISDLCLLRELPVEAFSALGQFALCLASGQLTGLSGLVCRSLSSFGQPLGEPFFVTTPVSGLLVSRGHCVSGD